MKVRISGNGGHREINLPVKDAELAHLAKLVGDGTENLWYRLDYVQEERNPLKKLIGQKVNMDEVNFFAKRMESLTAYEQGVLETYAAEQGMETVKDLINLTYSMKGLSLITDFSDGREVGRRLYMDEHLGISEEESRRMDFEAYGKKVLAEGNCKILPGGVFVTQGFEMQEVYNGRTFPEYVYDAGRTVAVLELKSKAGGRDYLYLPTDFYSVNLMKERLRIQGLWECSVEEVHNLQLPESLVPGPDRLRCVEELTSFNEMCAQVVWFGPESMKRLEMAVELAGAETYTDVTYIAKKLNEFEAVPSVHNDEEYGKFLVTESGIFEVDELLLPHIDYAGVAADKRDGTLAASGYVSGGFVGTEREIHEYLEYDGEFASPLERDSDCYQRFCLYSPLGGSLMVDGEDAETLYSRDLVPYVEEIGKISEYLQEKGIRTTTGKEKWHATVVMKMLRNEKYMGDALLQKTYTIDFMTKKKVINNGIVPQYYVEGDHEAIIPKELFFWVQEEIMRRSAMCKSAVTRKKNQKSKYSSGYALTGILLCGKCGQEYRRVTWARNGRKKIVWRCSNRLTNGVKKCGDSETLEEGALNRAVMEAIHCITRNEGDFVGAFRQNVIRVIGSYGREQQPDEYTGRIKAKQEEMVALIAENAKTGAYTQEFDERYRRIAEEINVLKEEQAEAGKKKKLAENYEQRVKDMDAFLSGNSGQIPEFDNDLVRRLVASIKVISADRIQIQFQSGIVMEQEIGNG